MILPNEIRRQVAGEKFIAGKEHGDGFEELQIRLMQNGAGDDRLEIRQWTRAENGARVPSRHGFIAPISVIPWIIETLSKIIPAESVDDDGRKI
jgi:hypothetical protein